MPDPLDRLQQLVRPRLLVGAARFGLGDWRRDRDLRRLLRRQDLPSPGLALSELLDHEALLEDARCLRAASYVIARHVELLTAVMAEARLAQSRDRLALDPATPAMDSLLDSVMDSAGGPHAASMPDRGGAPETKDRGGAPETPHPDASPRPARRSAGGRA